MLCATVRVLAGPLAPYVPRITFGSTLLLRFTSEPIRLDAECLSSFSVIDDRRVRADRYIQEWTESTCEGRLPSVCTLKNKIVIKRICGERES